MVLQVAQARMRTLQIIDMRFIAKILNMYGTIDVMELEADSKIEAETRLRAEGLRIIALSQTDTGLYLQFPTQRFDLDVFNQQLHSLLEAGQSIVDAIEILYHNDASGRDKVVYRGLLSALRQGKQFSSAMEQQSTIFPALFVAMVRATETTGGVSVAIDRYIHYRRQVGQLRSKLISASVYPAILIAVGMLVVSFLVLYVVPRFSIAFDDIQNKEQLAGVVYIWGSFVRAHGEIAWGCFGTLIFAIIGCMVHPAPRRFGFALLIKISAIGQRMRTFQLARLYRTLGLLLRSGLPLTQALRMSRDAMSVHFTFAMNAACAQVEEGYPLSRALSNHGLATEVASRLLVAGESSGNLDAMLERVANFHDQEVSGWVDLVGRIVEPALMIGIGLVIGVVVLLLYMPIFELANSVR